MLVKKQDENSDLYNIVFEKRSGKKKFLINFKPSILNVKTT